jgi:hypothetical protein
MAFNRPDEPRLFDVFGGRRGVTLAIPPNVVGVPLIGIISKVAIGEVMCFCNSHFILLWLVGGAKPPVIQDR